MTQRQTRAIFAVAMIIAVAGIVSVLISGRHDCPAPVEVGVIEPVPFPGDTASMTDVMEKKADKRRAKITRQAEPDHKDSPLYHRVPADGLQPVE